MTGSIIRLGLSISVNHVKEARYALKSWYFLFQTGDEKSHSLLLINVSSEQFTGKSTSQFKKL